MFAWKVPHGYRICGTGEIEKRGKHTAAEAAAAPPDPARPHALLSLFDLSFSGPKTVLQNPVLSLTTPVRSLGPGVHP